MKSDIEREKKTRERRLEVENVKYILVVNEQRVVIYNSESIAFSQLCVRQPSHVRFFLKKTSSSQTSPARALLLPFTTTKKRAKHRSSLALAPVLFLDAG